MEDPEQLQGQGESSPSFGRAIRSLSQLYDHLESRELTLINPESAGPDGIPGRLLKSCADQVAPVLTTIFNLSLAHTSS